MRAHDWAASPLGPPDTWPQRLRSIVNVVLTSRFAMWMGWGDELTFLYNDAYAPTLGVKQGWALGRSSREVWAEIWVDIGPRIERVLATGEATWDESLLLLLERSGYREETYHTFSYSPLRDDEGRIAGNLCVVTEETERIIGDRRLRTLRALAAQLADAGTEAAVIEAAQRTLAENLRDLPFTLLYLRADADSPARLVASTGFASPEEALARFAGTTALPWSAEEIDAGASRVTIEDLDRRLPGLPSGAWERAPNRAVAVPVARQGQERPAGYIVFGVNPHRALDSAYMDFFALIAGQVASGISNARAFDEERRRAAALAELDRAKTDFFSNVSHEFRTPLTLMLNPIEDLLRDVAAEDPAARRRLLELAHRNALRLLKLVNTLLDFSRIEAGRLQASYAPTDISAFTAELASSFRSAVERAGLELVIEALPLPQPVFLDRDMWEKIVLNLLSNAFKFTLAGRIEVRVSAAPDNTGAELTVRDTGTGIPEAEIPHLFERFHRVRGAQGRSIEGSGIGLALVQELVRLHGGSVAVASRLDEGSTFTVRLPYGSAHLPADRLNADMAPQAFAAGSSFVAEALRLLPDAVDEPDLPAPVVADSGHVLLADDNVDMRAYVERLLTAAGFTVAPVGDGAAALAAVRVRPPDLVLTDVMMPQLDGFGLLAALRADPATRDIPVILLSARAGEEARVEGLQAGADDYLTKPFNARELVARVEGNLRLARTRRESAARLRRAQQAGRIADWSWDLPDGRMTVSGEGAMVFGVLPEELPTTADDFLDRFPPDERRRFLAELRPMMDGETERHDSEFQFLHGDGTLRWVAFRAEIDARLPDGRPARLVGVTFDVTVRRQAEAALRELNETLEARVQERVAELAATNRQLLAQIEERERVEATLRQMQRLEAVGQLTSGVAHDFNNLLTVILGQLQFVSRDVDDPTLVRRLVMMQEAAERGANLTSQLLAFSRRQRLNPKVVDLNDAVGNMGDLLRSTLGGTVRLEIALTPDLWPALVDQTQLELVVLNLAINARDAMPVGGSLRIETRNVMVSDPPRPQEPPPGDYVLVAVTDTGTGMSPEVLDRVFEPFFTTKEPGRGSGLGLPQVYGFAQQSGGGVRIETEPGRGTTVLVYLPRATGASDRSEPAKQPTLAGETGRPRLLLVDDDSAVREVTRHFLEDIGYAVTEAGSGGAALDALDRMGGFDVLLIDFAMPGMNGAELARHVQARRPGTPMVFLTGYADQRVLDDIGGRAIVSKPFQPQVLAATLQAARGMIPERATPPRVSNEETAASRGDR